MNSLEELRTELNIRNLCYWIMYREVDKLSRHECPVLAIYGHCGLSKSCERCPHKGGA